MESDAKFEWVPIGKLRKNPFNPRRTFDVGRDAGGPSLKDFAVSIKKDGVMEPLIARKLNGNYQVACGERRRMAAEIAGLKAVPVMVRPLDDTTMRRYALVENLHRLELSDDETEEALGKIWEEDYGGETKGTSFASIARDLGLAASVVSDNIRAYRTRREEPELGAREFGTRTVASLSSLSEEAPREAKRVAKAVKAGTIGKRELEEIAPVIRAAPPERRPEIVRQIERAAETKVRAQREVEQTIRESRRYAEEGPSKAWEKALGADQRLLNRVSDFLATAERLDITFLELFATPDMRGQAVEMLERVRSRIDATLSAARRAEGRWDREAASKWPQLAGG